MGTAVGWERVENPVGAQPIKKETMRFHGITADYNGPLKQVNAHTDDDRYDMAQCCIRYGTHVDTGAFREFYFLFTRESHHRICIRTFSMFTPFFVDGTHAQDSFASPYHRHGTKAHQKKRQTQTH